MGSRTKAPDLTQRLDKTDILNIITMIEDGSTTSTISKAYHFSYSSLVRILQPWNWTDAQRHHWDYANLPEIKWPEGYKRPKATYAPLAPLPESPSELPSAGHKVAEYEGGGVDAAAYLKDEGKHVPMKKIIEIMDGPGTELIEDSPAEKYFNKLPDLRDLYPTARDKINHKELMHRLESVECCFELMSEEMTKLRAFLTAK